jgi:hypothetical protein
MAIQRQKDLRRRRRRHAKVRKLRAQLAKVRTESERQRLIEKLHRTSPFAPLET